MLRNHDEKLETCNRFILVPDMTAMTPMTTYLHTEQKKEILRFHVFDIFQTDVWLSVTMKQQYSTVAVASPSIITQSSPQATAISELYQNCTKSISPARSLGKRLDPSDADSVVGQIEAFEGAGFLQSFGQHLAVNNHHRARTCSPHRSTQPHRCWPCHIFTNPKKNV